MGRKVRGNRKESREHAHTDPLHEAVDAQDLPKLRKLAAVKSLINSPLRARCWPLLCGPPTNPDAAASLIPSSSTLPVPESGCHSTLREDASQLCFEDLAATRHRDSSVVNVDVDRSLWAFMKGASDEELLAKRIQLKRLINAAVAAHATITTVTTTVTTTAVQQTCVAVASHTDHTTTTAPPQWSHADAVHTDHFTITTTIAPAPQPSDDHTHADLTTTTPQSDSDAATPNTPITYSSTTNNTTHTHPTIVLKPPNDSDSSDCRTVPLTDPTTPETHTSPDQMPAPTTSLKPASTLEPSTDAPSLPAQQQQENDIDHHQQHTTPNEQAAADVTTSDSSEQHTVAPSSTELPSVTHNEQHQHQHQQQQGQHQEQQAGQIQQQQNHQQQQQEKVQELVATHQEVFYYQGLHDVASVLLLIMGSETAAFPLLCRLIGPTGPLRDATRPDLLPVLEVLSVLYPIMDVADPEIAKRLRGEGLPPFFALSWFITWFAHNVTELHEAARLFDLFLSSHPLMPLYLGAVAICAVRDELLECEDMPMMHSLLNNLRLPQLCLPHHWKVGGRHYSNGAGGIVLDLLITAALQLMRDAPPLVLLRRARTPLLVSVAPAAHLHPELNCWVTPLEPPQAQQGAKQLPLSRLLNVLGLGGALTQGRGQGMGVLLLFRVIRQLLAVVVRQGGVHIVVGGLRAFGGRGLLWGGRGLQWGGRGLQWGGRGVVQWVGSTLRISSSPPSAASLSAATASDTQSQQGARLSSQRLIEGVEVHEREEQQSGEEISGEAGGSTHTQGQREGSQALRQRRGSERMNKRAESDLGGAEEPEGPPSNKRSKAVLSLVATAISAGTLVGAAYFLLYAMRKHKDYITLH